MWRAFAGLQSDARRGKAHQGIVGTQPFFRTLSRRGQQAGGIGAVSYTHLDVYKRQALNALHLAADFVIAVRGIQARVAAEGLRDGDYDVPYSTLHVGKLNGGVQVNIVPNTAVVDFEIRSLAGEDTGALIAELRSAAEAIVAPLRAEFPEAEIRIDRLWDYPGLGTPSDAGVVNFVKALTGANGTCLLYTSRCV